jgi:formate hydrogenlyase transcriptional activator
LAAEIMATPDRALSGEATKENQPAQITEPLPETMIIGKSLVLMQAMRQLRTVAATDSAVLILGETGTGKELVARRIHECSSRRHHAFVRADCAALPAGLLESELFGHERGAFTGAIARNLGRFELADQGTLFLDEVGDIPLELQSKLLRVLQEQELERLGSTRTIRVNFRLVTATNRELGELAECGRFRQDLYYRLNVFPIRLPPLRERVEDIPLLVWHFLNDCAHRLKKCFDVVRPEDMERLCGYAWPGNIRELQNVVERSAILSENGTLEIAPLTNEKRHVQNDVSEAESLAAVMKRHILQILNDTEWVISGPNGAAARLGLKRTTLLDKMRRLGISRPNA